MAASVIYLLMSVRFFLTVFLLCTESARQIYSDSDDGNRSIRDNHKPRADLDRLRESNGNFRPA